MKIMPYVKRWGLTLLAAVLMTGCEGSGSSGSGGSTIQGNVLSVDGVRIARQMLLSRTHVAGSSIMVSVDGLEISAVASADGVFVLNGLKAGSYALVFTHGTETGTYSVDVPANAVVTLEGVVLNNGKVSVHEVEVEVENEAEDEVEDDDGNDNDEDEHEDEHEDENEDEFEAEHEDEHESEDD